MPGTIQEIQLVAVKAIPRRQSHQHGEDDSANPDHAPVEWAGDRHHGSGGQGLPRSLAGFGGWDRAGVEGLAQPGQRSVAAGAGCPGVAGWIIAGGGIRDWCSFGAESGGKPGSDAPRSGPPWRPLLLSLPGSARAAAFPEGRRCGRLEFIGGPGTRRAARPLASDPEASYSQIPLDGHTKFDADIEASLEEMTPSSARVHPDAPDTTSSPGQMKTRHLLRHIQRALARVIGELTS